MKKPMVYTYSNAKHTRADCRKRDEKDARTGLAGVDTLHKAGKLIRGGLA